MKEGRGGDVSTLTYTPTIIFVINIYLDKLMHNTLEEFISRPDSTGRGRQYFQISFFFFFSFFAAPRLSVAGLPDRPDMGITFSTED